MNNLPLEMTNVKYRWPGMDTDFLNVKALTIEPGEKILLQGPSGSGKSTLLNLIAGTLMPTSGDIGIGGSLMSKSSQVKNDRLRANMIGMIFQQFNLIPYLSIFQNITLPLHVSKKRAEVVTDPRNAVSHILSNLNLGDLPLNMRVSKLSVGQQQRVAAARAIIGDPKLVIADEPTSALDDEARDSFMRLFIDETQKTQAAVLFVSHDTRLEVYFDRIIALRDFKSQ